MPIDLLNQRFPRVWRGYRRSPVDDFLRELAGDYEEVVAENARLRDSLDGARRELESYRAMEATLKDALILAQKTADETRAAAHREADTALTQAHERAAALKEETERSLEAVRMQRRRFAREFRLLLEGYLAELAEDMACDDAPACVHSDAVR